MLTTDESRQLAIKIETNAYVLCNATDAQFATMRSLINESKWIKAVFTWSFDLPAGWVYFELMSATAAGSEYVVNGGIAPEGDAHT